MKRSLKLSTVAIALGLLCTFHAPAYAAETAEDASAPATMSRIDPNSPIVVQDKAEAEEVKEAGLDNPTVTSDVSATASCDSWRKVTGFIGAYGPQDQSACAIWGSVGLIVGYTWAVQAGTNQYACTQGYGYSTTYPQYPVWRSTKCGKSNSSNVHWGNVLDYRKFKAMSTNQHLALVSWR